MIKHRRRTFLIKTGLQLRYVGIIVSTMLLVAVLVGYIFFTASWNRIIDTPDLTIDKLGAIYDSVSQTLTKWFIVIIFAIAILAIFVSHKIAGPVYRLERSAKILASGDLTQNLKLRHGDELKDLQDAFNSMSESLRKMIAKDREVIGKLVAAGTRLNETMKKKKQDPESIEGVAKELYNIIEELRIVTAGFKIDPDLSGQDDSREPTIEEL